MYCAYPDYMVLVPGVELHWDINTAEDLSLVLPMAVVPGE